LNIDAVIFDVDGTLWDANQAVADGWNCGLAKLGINKKVSPELLAKVTGNPYEKCVDILLPGLKKKYPDLLVVLNEAEVESVCLNGGQFYDGVIEGIKQLSEIYKIFLVSNCKEWYLKAFLKFSGLKSKITDFDCNGTSGLNKSEMLLRIKNIYSLNNPLYVGDTEGDQIAAKMANIEFVYVSWGFGKPIPETKTINSFSELLSYQA